MARQKVHLDPAIAAIMGDGEKRAEQRKMTPAQRQRARQRVPRQAITLQLHAGLVPLLRDIAAALNTSTAGVADRLLLDALQRYADGHINFDDYLEPSDSPRYPWVVRINPNGLAQALQRRLTDGEN